mmetsp:Transcript_20614/g.26570  ORF Transcript_20614/g.26570 Transcript_20614/m.26570 type:complete len:277 (-) Transcript_20614:184-1014(-)|eukprot:CAMPEP_0198141842 /NCGR_PEP_ID=MMETSP1443-20131203/4778_1 /TAXON_ID=186043 /ORGANISM="Entomoneis sp., Strain CCMP2396" /LENGTH=276 /DNA_ID=CAMNT_0043804713 /DNA_START=144 /DNA_END=974 /DNA_ORIENTATION=+
MSFRGSKDSIPSSTTTSIQKTTTVIESTVATSAAKSKMNLSPAQQNLLDRFKTNPDTGLTSDEVTARREESGCFNIVKPPIDCPPALCVILPCIKHLPSMKAFKAIQPDDAEVLRSGEWIQYDVTSLVPGDIIRLEEGDIVPADCVVLTLSSDHVQELLVDVRAITAEEKPRSAKRVMRQDPTVTSEQQLQQQQLVEFVQPTQLYWGGTVVQGGCIAVVTAIGPQCFVATLIAQGKFPPPPDVLNKISQDIVHGEYEDNPGIALVQAQPPMVRETV